MTNETTISGLNKASGVSESDIIPIVSVNESTTEKVTLGTLRNSIYFQNAFSDHTTALAATSKGESYFVYTDTTETFVKGWTNQGGSNYSAMIGLNGDVIFPAGNLFSSLKSYILGVDSFSDLCTLEPMFEGQIIKLLGYYSGGYTGGGDFIAVMSAGTSDSGTLATSGTTAGYYWKRINYSYLTPEMFGAVGDATTDDYDAFASVITYLQHKPNNLVVGQSKYALSQTLEIYGLGYGLDIKLFGLVAHSSFVGVTDANWRTAPPLIRIGSKKSLGGPVGLNLSIDWLDGNKVASACDIYYYGAGGSHIHIGRMINVVNGVSSPSIQWPSSSNKVTGNYWSAGSGQAIRVGQISSDSVYTNEGWIVDVNFITGFNRGAVYGTDGGMFLNFRGQSDFNGYYLSLMTVSADATSAVKSGDSISNGTKTFTVISAYQQFSGVYSILVDEGSSVKDNGSSFSVGDTLTSGTWTGTVNAITIPGTNNWYPDIILDYKTLARAMIQAPYTGGVLGNSLLSSNIMKGHSTNGYGNSFQGNSFVHSGSACSWFDSYLNSYVFTATNNYIAPYRHLYMRTYRTYGTEIYMALYKATNTTIHTFSKVGDGTVPSVKESWRVSVSCTLTGVYGEWIVYVNGSGLEIVNVYKDNILSISSSGNSFIAAQGAQTVLITVWNLQRIF